MRRLILGTAGHIDHGKTSLVRALTGVDTDRLPEEKRRGITIDLGFASLTLRNVAHGDAALADIEFGIVDVPGHEALVRNMLAGATGIDVMLMVIAADEGVMPQTREHLAIMEFLAAGSAVVAITKADLVDQDWLDLVIADVAEILATTRFADAPIVPVSSTTGAGLDALRDALVRVTARIPERTNSDLFRMPIDRVFTVHGTGTVVTGTVWSGEVQRDAKLIVMPDGTEVRARGLQAHGTPRDTAGAGERVAAALAIDRQAVQRGQTLVSSPAWSPSWIVTAHVHMIADAAKPLKHRQRLRFHIGTAEILARVAILESGAIEPGDTGWIQLRLESPCIARAGDRFVLRAYSPVATIAGGVIAEPRPGKRKRVTPDVAYRLQKLTDPAAGNDATDALLQLAGVRGVPVVELRVRTAAPPAPGLGERLGDRLYHRDQVELTQSAILGAVDAFHNANPMASGIPRAVLINALVGLGQDLSTHVLDRMLERGPLRNVDGMIARADFERRTDPAQDAAARQVLEILKSAGLEPPAIAEMAEPLKSRSDILSILRFLESRGEIVALARDRYADRGVIEALADRLSGRFAKNQELSTTDLKEAIGVSRKYLIPLLEFFDREGITRRSGEMRIWNGRTPISRPTAGQIP